MVNQSARPLVGPSLVDSSDLTRITQNNGFQKQSNRMKNNFSLQILIARQLQKMFWSMTTM